MHFTSKSRRKHLKIKCFVVEEIEQTYWKYIKEKRNLGIKIFLKINQQICRLSKNSPIRFQDICYLWKFPFLFFFLTTHIIKDFQIKIKHFINTDQYLVAFGLVSEVYFSGGLCKADKWFIFIWKSLHIIFYFKELRKKKKIFSIQV